MMSEQINHNNFNIGIGEFLYWLFFGSLLFAKGIGLYDGQFIFKLALIFATVCLVLKVFIEKYTVAEMIRMAMVIAITGVTYLVSGEKGLLIYGMMMIGMKHVNVKRVFSLGAILWTIAFFGTILTSFFHMQDTVYKVHLKLGLGHIFRWSLGYPHPNVLHVSYFVLTVFIVYLLGERFRLKHALGLFTGNFLVFLYSVSYTGFIVVICLLLGRLYLMLRKKLTIIEKFLLQLIFPICVILSLIVPVTISVNSNWFKLLNKIFSQRMELGWLYLRRENISLWGQRLSEITSSSKTMDNAYLFAFITYGIIPFIILCMATIYMIYKYLKEDRYLETLIIISIIVGGITEPFLYNTSFKNLSFIFMGTLLFENKKGEKEWSLIPWEKLPFAGISDKKIVIRIGKTKIIKEMMDDAFKINLGKLLAGVLFAIFLCLMANRFISYPVGYVVYRIDCSGIPNEKIYYNEDAEEYKHFKNMHDFKEGEEIEYFSGNIVKMEKIRNNISSIFLGFSIGYFAIGIVGYYWTGGKQD